MAGTFGVHNPGRTQRRDKSRSSANPPEGVLHRRLSRPADRRAVEVIIETKCLRNPGNRMRANRNHRSPAIDQILDVSSAERTSTGISSICFASRIGLARKTKPTGWKCEAGLNRLVPSDRILAVPSDTN